MNPPADAPGWYLQRPPANGIHRIEPDGSWSGTAQVGNAQSPPHEGDKVDLTVSAADRETIEKLMSEQGVLTKDQPVGNKTDTAQGITVMLNSP